MSEFIDFGRLTKRQRETLELVARGLTNEDIARALGVSFTTVRSHVTGILAALEVGNRTEAAARYLAAQARPERVDVVLDRPAVAVLPFVALDDDARTRTLAGAIARELASLCARSCWFPVISQLSTAQARTLDTTSQGIGKKLGARFLVDGTLVMVGPDWRLDVQIDDSETGQILWTERFTFASEQVFEQVSDICAQLVAIAYPVLIERFRSGRVRDAAPGDLSAWELAHHAMDLCATRARESNARAADCFARAAERDSTLVIAHFGTGLSAYDDFLCQWGDPMVARDRLAAAADRCIHIAPHLGEGYFLQARYYQACAEHERVVPPLEAAVARNPSFAQAHALLAQALHVSGRKVESMARMRQALRLGPRAFVAGLSMLHFMRGEYLEALAAAEEAITYNPRYTFARVMGVVSARQAGDEARAAEHLRHLLRDYPPFSADGFRRAFGTEIDGVRRIASVLESMGVAR